MTPEDRARRLRDNMTENALRIVMEREREQFRNYIYRLAEGVSGEYRTDGSRWYLIRDDQGNIKFPWEWTTKPGIKPTKTPAGWRYDA